jgi:hypothetical protein
MHREKTVFSSPAYFEVCKKSFNDCVLNWAQRGRLRDMTCLGDSVACVVSGPQKEAPTTEGDRPDARLNASCLQFVSWRLSVAHRIRFIRLSHFEPPFVCVCSQFVQRLIFREPLIGC